MKDRNQTKTLMYYTGGCKHNQPIKNTKWSWCYVYIYVFYVIL